MSIFNELDKKLSNLSKETIGKTKQMADNIKINSMISELNKKNEELFSEVGKMYFEKYRSELNSELEALCINIEENMQEVQSLNAALAKQKNFIICPQCGAENQKGSSFCNNCGTKIIQEIIEPKRCPKCNSILKDGQRFCNECGTKLDVDAVKEIEINEEATIVNVCPHCGKELKPGQLFCNECGTKIK